MNMLQTSDAALESRARRLAKRAGLLLRKSRRMQSYDQRGEFMVVDAQTNFPQAGFQFDMSAVEVIDWLNTSGPARY